MNDKSVSIRCPECNYFLAKVDRVDVESADAAQISFMLETKCPKCKRKDRRLIDAFLPKIGGVVNRK